MRLIDADNAIHALGAFSDMEHGNKHFLNGINSAKEIINECVTIDAARKRCRKENNMNERECNYCKEDSCELCFNAGHYIICEDGMNETCEYFQKMNYCPNCGAKMEVEP